MTSPSSDTRSAVDPVDGPFEHSRGVEHTARMRLACVPGVGRSRGLLKTPHSRHAARRAVTRVEWCGSGDLNPDGLAPTSS